MAFTSAGYGGSNANAGAYGLDQFGGPSMGAWNQANQQMGASGALNRGGSPMDGRQYMGQLNPGTGVSFGGGAAGVGGGAGGGDLAGLLNKQMGLYDKADAANEANWNQGKNLLLDSQNQYNNSAITQGNRNLVAGLQADPYTINAQTQANIQGNAAAGINAGNAATQKHVAGLMAANGQGDAGSMAALAERGNRQGGAQLGQTMSNLQVQKAFQDKQDIQNAAHLGQQQAAQDQGVNFGTAQSFLQNMPQHIAPNLAGYAAQMGRAAGPQVGFQGGWGQQQQFGGNRMPFGGGFRTHPFNGGGTTTFGGGGPDNYANAGGGGPGAGLPNQSRMGGY